MLYAYRILMRLLLDTDAPTPLFRQIADQFRLKIAQGELQPGDDLPSVRHVAQLVRVNLNTVAKAYRLLADEGLVELQHGRGAHVRKPAKARRGSVPVRAQRELEAWVARMRTHGLGLAALRDAFDRAVANAEGRST